MEEKQCHLTTVSLDICLKSVRGFSKVSKFTSDLTLREKFS